MSERMQLSLADVTLAWTPFLVAFVVIPTAIYVPNQIEFEYELTPILAHVAMSVLILGALLGLVLLKSAARSRVASALFFIGLFIFISDIIAPLQWGEFNGNEKLTEPLRFTLLQGALAGVCAGLWYLVPIKFVRTVGVPVVCALLAVQVYELTRACLEASSNALPARALAADKSNKSDRKLPNIYHFVFDAYSSLIFLDSLKALDLRDDLDGFTFFPRTLSNYPATASSVPSFMSGKLFRGGSFKQFQLDAKSGGVRRALQEAGYRISTYSPDRVRPWSYDGADYVVTGRQLARQPIDGFDAVARLAQITLVRVAPNFLRQEMFKASGAALSKIARPVLEIDGVTADYTDYRYYKFISVPVVKRFIQDEAARPSSGQYIYLHVVMPHLPQILDADCKLTQPSPDPIIGYTAQVRCATKLMGEIVDEIKVRGRYDDSAIIFQSDHGMDLELGSPYPEPKPPSAQVAEQLRKTNLYFSPEAYFQRLRALLVVKPPSAGKRPFEIAQTQTQLADVAATLYHFAGIEGRPSDGVSVFSPEALKPREIEVFTGLHYQRPDGDLGILGRNGVLAEKLSEIELAHFGYSSENGWRVYANIPAAW